MSYGPKWKSNGPPVLTKSAPGGDAAEKITMTTTDPSRLKELDALAEEIGPPPEEAGQSNIVMNYRACLETMYTAMTKPNSLMDGGIVFGSKAHTDPIFSKGYSKKVWTLLKSARLVAIPSKLYNETHESWDKRLCRELGYAWRPPGLVEKIGPPPEEEQWAVCEHTANRAEKTPFPERLPFEVTYFGYGSEGQGGPFITSNQLAYRTDWPTADRMQSVHLMSTLISSTGYCIDFFRGIDRHNPDGRWTVFMSVQHDPDHDLWYGYGGTKKDFRIKDLGPVGKFKIDLTPFIISSLVEHVSSFVDLHEPCRFSKEEKKDWRYGRKKTGVKKGEPPPHYYPYKLRSESHSEEGGNTGKRRDLSYRTDVRAHERLLVRRGERPIPPEKDWYYMMNGFTVYQEESLPWHMKARLAAKGHPDKQPNEWVAVKRVWIKHHMNSNDETLPYRQKLTIAGERT